MTVRRDESALDEAIVDRLGERALDRLAERLRPRLPVQPLKEPAGHLGLDPEPFMTAEEVARAARLHPQTVYRHLRSGRLRGQLVGSRWRISPDAYDDYVSTGRLSQAPRRTSASRRRPAATGRGPLRAVLDAERDGG